MASYWWWPSPPSVVHCVAHCRLVSNRRRERGNDCVEAITAKAVTLMAMIPSKMVTRASRAMSNPDSVADGVGVDERRGEH